LAFNHDYGSPFATDFDIRYAEYLTYATYGDRVSVYSKAKDLLKFGKTSDADSGQSVTIMTLPSGVYNETYLSSNAIDSFSSGSTDDITQTFSIEGHTIDSDGNLIFTTQTTGVITGQTRAALPTPLARITRVSNNSNTSLTGPVYFYENTALSSGAPSDGTKVHLMLAAGKDQSEKAATAISYRDYWFVTQMSAGINRNTGNVKADIELQIRQQNGVFRSKRQFGLSTTGTSSLVVPFRPYLIVPKNSDIRLVVTTDTNDTVVTGDISGYLALVV